MPETSWQKSQMLPIVRRIIHQLCATHQRYVSHLEIRDAILQDAEAIDKIRKAQLINTTQTTDQIASNIVAWFSKAYTEQSSD
jgi:hypothetical protein